MDSDAKVCLEIAFPEYRDSFLVYDLQFKDKFVGGQD